MTTVKVTYTVKPGFVQRNKENIQLFMADFKKMDTKQFKYAAYLCKDGKTFVHISHWDNGDIQRQVLQVPSFLSFQRQRDDSGLEGTHHLEEMDMVASTNDIF